MVRSGNERAFVRPRRFIAMGLAIVVVFTSLTVRLWDLQVVNGAQYRTLSEQNRVLRIPVEAERGNIVDRTGSQPQIGLRVGWRNPRSPASKGCG